MPMVTQRLGEGQGPVVAVTDYMTLVPDQIARWVPRRFIPLGTDGFGRSDTRESLRRFFETDAHSVISTVLSALTADGSLDPEVARDAVAHYDLNRPHFDPTG